MGRAGLGRAGQGRAGQGRAGHMQGMGEDRLSKRGVADNTEEYQG